MVESAGERDDEAETRSYNWPAIGFSLVSARRLQLMKSSTVESTLERRDVNCMLAKGTCYQGRGLLPIILRSAIFFFFHHLFLPHFPSLVSPSFCTLDCVQRGNRGVNRLYNVFIFFSFRLFYRWTEFLNCTQRKNANLSAYWKYDRLKIV